MARCQILGPYFLSFWKLLSCCHDLHAALQKYDASPVYLKVEQFTKICLSWVFYISFSKYMVGPSKGRLKFPLFPETLLDLKFLSFVLLLWFYTSDSLDILCQSSLSVIFSEVLFTFLSFSFYILLDFHSVLVSWTFYSLFFIS